MPADLEAQLEALRRASERPTQGDPVARYRRDAAAFEAADLARSAGADVPSWAAAAIFLARGGVAEQLPMLKNKYNETGNPMFAFRARATIPHKRR